MEQFKRLLTCLRKKKAHTYAEKSVVRDLTITAFSNKYTFFSYILTVGVPKSDGEKIKGGSRYIFRQFRDF